MFSIHSLAAKLGSDSAWLLNNLELSRVKWKKGAHEGELIIERDTTYEDLEGVDGRELTAIELRMTRVGKFDDRTW
jgi:hypothetical protein